ncbi:membrane lipoprotein lipid attachment site-containing protein [Fusobacterium pseudoperiodonticum]|uniref:membrane lipoprotein lipid attachment site-containing protein n=1 Tax=Fusobacterium pseudoperiodonticum TaxID=2663009 RepID=UPI0028E5FE18|nr:membrane lipoprotein lipid attachment site-containing protein [Fusobacterium pseudoperiodonticum]
MKKIIFLFIMILTLTGCKTVEISTSYGYKVTNQKEKVIYDKVQIDGNIIDSSKGEKEPLESISIISKDKNNSIKETPKKIKIVSNNREYLVSVDFKYNTIYPVYDKGIIIDSDSFILEIGNIKFKDGTTLYIPPLLFKRHIYVCKINNFLDALNQNTREDLFSGTIDEYREWKKKNK